MGLSQTLRFILGHPMNRGRPIRTLARFAKWQVQSHLQDEVIFDWIDGSKLAVRRGMTGATGNIYCGLHEYVDMSFALHFLLPGDRFLDVGANIGSYTILASAVCGAEVIAIEPDPNTASYLAKNIEENGVGGLCSVAQTAVGRYEGRISFTVGKDTVNQVQNNTQEPSQVVSLTRIDSLLDDWVPSLVKMDVEGYELEALSGAKKMLSSSGLMAIIIENTDPEVVSFLNSHGYSRYTYDPISRRLSEDILGMKSNNGIFVRNGTRPEVRLKKSARRTFRGQLV